MILGSEANILSYHICTKHLAIGQVECSIWYTILYHGIAIDTQPGYYCRLAVTSFLSGGCFIKKNVSVHPVLYAVPDKLVVGGPLGVTSI